MRIRYRAGFWMFLLVFLYACLPLPAPQAEQPLPTASIPAPTQPPTPYPTFQISVEIEEPVYLYEDLRNGSGPLWSFGSSLVASHQGQVFVSGLVPAKGANPPNNAHCVIFQRAPSGWQPVLQLSEPTREPCPIAAGQDALWIFANPAYKNLSQPQLLQLPYSQLQEEPRVLLPAWQEGHRFNAWSYRGLGLDVTQNRLWVTNISGDEAQYWAFLDETQHWQSAGKLRFPSLPAQEATPTTTLQSPASLRLTYPALALSGQYAYILAVSDIESPQANIHTYLKNSGESTYLFQHIYVAWTEDIASQPFSEWTELTNLEPAGNLRHQDIWLSPDGTAHLLWTEESLDERLSIFFPQVQPQSSLWYAVLRQGQVLSKTRLIQTGPTEAQPVRARFHQTPSGRMFVFYSTHHSVYRADNFALEIYPQGNFSISRPINLEIPLEYFLSFGQRNGAPAANTFEMIGIADWQATEVRYVRLKIE
jgi:hypothetical protein